MEKLFALIALLYPSAAFAFTLANPLGGTNTVPELIKNIIGGILSVVGALALVVFVYGGFLWLTAMGEDKRVKQGWDTMTWAAMGLAVIFASYAIVTLILKSLP